MIWSIKQLTDPHSKNVNLIKDGGNLPDLRRQKSHAYRTLKSQDSKMQCVTLDWIMGQEKAIIEDSIYTSGDIF